MRINNLNPSRRIQILDLRCPDCNQIDVGQRGEYPCPTCGLPTMWDPNDIQSKKIGGKRNE